MSDSLSLDEILFGSVKEGRIQVVPSKGSIPEDLCGTYYLNGPANFRKSDFTYEHWLDGDGLIRALRLENGKAEHTMRFVRSKKFTEEREAGKPIFRAFGTAFQGDKLRRRMSLESPVNVSIWPFGNRLLAFGEQALPWELEPDTLETIEECNFNGKLLEISPFSAHPKIDSKNGRLCNFGLKYLMSATRLCYWEFNEDFECQCEWQIDPGNSYSVHDFAVSDRYVAFYLSPYMLDIGAFVRKQRSIYDALDWHPEMENVLLIKSRNGQGEVNRLPLGRRGYCLHLIQSFEEGDLLTIDFLETEEPLYHQYLPLPSLFNSVKPCSFARIVVDTTTWTVREKLTASQNVHLDFPALFQRNHHVQSNLVWTLAMPVEPSGESKYYDRILRFDWHRVEIVDCYRCPEGCYLSGEPAIIPAAEKNLAGHLLCPEWNSNSNESAYLIFNAFELEKGPIAVLPLDSPSPLAFHSTFLNVNTACY